MKRIARFVVRPLVLGPLVVVLAAATFVTLTSNEPAPRAATSALGEPTEFPTIDTELIKPPLWAPPTMTPTPTPKPVAPKPTPKPTPKPKPKPKPKPPAPSVVAFKGLGAWIDLYDYAAVEPEAATADMHAHGVRTLYLQTARWNKPDPASSVDFQDPALLERWVHAAHKNYMRIVGWYLPAYDNLARDVKRSVAIATYRTTKGERFDAAAIDIEYKGQVDTLSGWNAAIVEHLRWVRIGVGSLYPLAAIVPAPLAMEVHPSSWTNFPWKGLAAYTNIFMPMAYWSYRTDCPEVPEHCAYGYAKGNAEQVRALTGKPGLTVHVLGGVGDSVTAAEVNDFVKGSKAAAAYGGSLYDYRTTAAAFWAPLQQFG